MPVINSLEWTFDTQAELYSKMRPGYVDALYRDIFSYIDISNSSNVLEIGIGAGQATLPILQTGCKLTAVERGMNFAQMCTEKFKEYPNFSLENTYFENFKYKSGSYDLIYSASAFHWIPEEIGYSKVFDMLKTSGAFARFANHPYVENGTGRLYDEIQKLYDKYMPGNVKPVAYTEQDAKKRAEIALKYGFKDIFYKLYHRKRIFSAKEYTMLLGTYSDHIALEENTKKNFFSEMESVIDHFGGKVTVYDTIDLELMRKP